MFTTMIGVIRAYINGKKNDKDQHLGFTIVIFLAIAVVVVNLNQDAGRQHTLARLTTRICIQVDKNSLKARHKSCFLRPDTGPCRADIIQYYFDAMRGTCYRFFWGGCQGNGNRFNDKLSCMTHCVINSTMPTMHVPYFCSLAFDFGTCFGHYNRWAWDKYSKTCKRRLYSGCGGNQNNFETKRECMATCLNPPNNTLHRIHKYTTCIPFTIGDLH